MRVFRLWLPVFFALAAQPQQARAADSWWDDGWAVTAFAGVLSVEESSDIWLHGDFELADDTLVGVGLSKRLFSVGRDLDFELELQSVKHFGGQNDFEFNLPLIVRWNTFPWDSFIDTSVAFGDGLSIATETPDLEKARYGGDKSGAALNFVMVELTLSLPEHPNIQFVNRFQHRSGAFGLINNTSDASTAFVWGFKFRF
ncbi:MAG TPA: hypothetical protein VE914_20465 [Candidatus Angelobacter sp.]|nr:hypothetical protein [Candidatus Angelobacter sp.]